MTVTSRRGSIMYDTKEGIFGHLTDLASFNELVKLRREAGYERRERLGDFFVFGRYNLDSVGNLGKIHGDFIPGEKFPELPAVLTREEMWDFLKQHVDGETSLAWGFDTGIPPVRVVCSVCDKPWSIRDCHDFVTKRTMTTLSLALYKYMTLKEVRDHLAGRTDALYWMNDGQPIRNDRFIDLSPHPKFKTMKANEFGWAGKDEGVTESYVIQEGDEASVSVWKCFHKACVQKYLEQTQRERFEKIFRDAGFKKFTLVAIPNQYCGNTTCCAPWFEASTPLGSITIGWRKRVIHLDWSNTKVSANVPGENDVTCGLKWSHAWGEEKATEYLRRIWEAGRRRRNTQWHN